MQQIEHVGWFCKKCQKFDSVFTKEQTAKPEHVSHRGIDIGRCKGVMGKVFVIKGCSMDREKAKSLLGKSVNKDGGLFNLGWYLAWIVSCETATLDGAFEADELEAIAWWMRNNKKNELNNGEDPDQV